MKVGDRVICIDNYNANITINKVYEISYIEKFPDIRYWIKDDGNLGSWHYSYSFTTLKEIRKQKLEKINGSQG